MALPASRAQILFKAPRLAFSVPVLLARFVLCQTPNNPCCCSITLCHIVTAHCFASSLLPATLRCVAASLVLRSAVTLECGGSASMVADRSISLPVRASAACFVPFRGFCSSRVACGFTSESAVSGWWCSLARPLAFLCPLSGRALFSRSSFALKLGHVLVLPSRLLPSARAVSVRCRLVLAFALKLRLWVLLLLCSAVAGAAAFLSCWLSWPPARCPRASCCLHPESPASMLAYSAFLRG